jgi:hypothetical protein
MLTIVCSMQECRTGLRIDGELEVMESLFLRSDWHPDNYPCPRCGAPSSMIESISPMALQHLQMSDLSPQEAYAAFNGLGLPDEHDCGPTAVEQLLLNQKVVKVDAKLIKGSHRSVLRSIEFDNGTRMYLSSSPFGSTVYRIAPKRSFTEEVLREQD